MDKTKTTAEQLIDMYNERITLANKSQNYLDAHNNHISVNTLKHLISVIDNDNRNYINSQESNK